MAVRTEIGEKALGAAHKRLALAVLMGVLLPGCGKKGTADWIQDLGSADSSVRLHAVNALGGRRGEAPQVVPALARALQDPDPFVRREVANSLGRIGPDARDAVPGLVACVRDRQPHVRKAAVAALKKVDPEAAAKIPTR
jgi:HEAT repeat protein